MKKTVAAALTAAFVVGVSSSAFAAANPFSDVPAGHWAYNSVSKLAAEGVIEGYGDGTYRGDRNITRYEMAQMIAKAMAKNPTGANKAELDR
ncbi:MAG: S-layer homology domain-containing protein, partial [Selenomonadaceae bacterium]|nr:S-layer homology domain-containing protein [Selenomonadaceae bacterium]